MLMLLLLLLPTPISSIPLHPPVTDAAYIPDEYALISPSTPQGLTILPKILLLLLLLLLLLCYYCNYHHHHHHCY